MWRDESDYCAYSNVRSRGILILLAPMHLFPESSRASSKPCRTDTTIGVIMTPENSWYVLLEYVGANCIVNMNECFRDLCVASSLDSRSCYIEEMISYVFSCASSCESTISRSLRLLGGTSQIKPASCRSQAPVAIGYRIDPD